jgi:TPR repeat protein
MSFRGEGVLQDYKAAREMICKGADLGDPDAQFNCGGLLAQGQGGEKDQAKALAFYEKAAGQGHIGAMNALAFAYRDGAGVPKDAAKARSWFEKAARKGNPVGLYEMGALYESGAAGGAPDLAKAHLYYNLASARHHPQASEALQRVSAALPPEAVEKAQAEARAWKAVP